MTNKKHTDSTKALIDRLNARASASEKKPAQLPQWPDAVRAAPNSLLRSALFGVVAKGRRRYIDGEQIAALDGIDIRYKGQRLDQDDLDVWESVLHAVRHQELGSRCKITTYALLKLIGLSDTGKNRATLQDRIERLVACAVTVRYGQCTYIGSLIRFAAKNEKTQEWIIELDPRLRALFAADQYTQIDWAIRRDLKGHPLAQWLHSFYASHAQPYPLKIETLHRLCGSEAGEIWKFAQMLRNALDAIAHACAAHGHAFSYNIRDGLVYAEKTPSPPQLRHLAKKADKLPGPRE